VIGFASSEIDSTAKRLIRKRWPGVIELGSVTSIDNSAVSKLAAVYDTLIDFVLVGAGSPCQDLSGLRAGGLGLEGENSKLFFEVPRIIELLRSCFLTRIEYFVEDFLQHD
jgi:site-specific DNA-cytosine methylase